MKYKTQAKKNLKLIEKLSAFLLSHPEIDSKLPDNASLVTFSANDKLLNEANRGLLKGLLEEGKPVIQVVETNDRKNPWKFTPIAA